MVRVDAVLVVVVGLGAALLDVAVAAGTEVVAVRAVAVPVDVVGTVLVAVVAVAVADDVDEAVAVVAVELVLLDGGLVVRTCTMSSAAEHAASTVVRAAAPTTTAPHRPRARRRPIAALPEACTDGNASPRAVTHSPCLSAVSWTVSRTVSRTVDRRVGRPVDLPWRRCKGHRV